MLLPRYTKALLAALALITAGSALGQYPAKPVKWIVPIAAGGPNDIMTRAVAAELATAIGQPVIIENRAGAAYIVGAEAVAKSAPDGYTILTAPAALLVFQKLTYSKLPYDSQKDFSYIGIVANSVMGLFIHASVPVKTV